jgi:Piwi domain
MINPQHPDRIAFSFLPAGTSDFAYDIYRKELGQNEASVPGTRFLPREIESGRVTPSDQRIRYAVSLASQNGYEKIRIGARVNRSLTVHVLHRALEAKCQAPELAPDVEVPEKHFFQKIGFILKHHEQGVRELIWATAYDLKVINRFGFALDFKLRVPPSSGVLDKKRLELSLTHKNGRINEDFYLDHYKKVEEFLQRFFESIRMLPLHDGGLVELERRLPLIDAFTLKKRTFVFADGKEGMSPFFGLRKFGPSKTPSRKPRIVFVFLDSDRPKSQDLFRALRGDTYNTFPGMQNMFKVQFDRDNVSGIPVSGFTTSDLQNACLILRTQYPTEVIVPVVLVPMSKHSSDLESRNYFIAKHAFLSESIASQFVDRKRLDDHTALKWSISNIGLALFAKMGGVPWRLKVSTEKCLVVGIGQAHRVVNGSVERYFAYSVLADSSGIYERITLLGDSSDFDAYLNSLKANLRDVLVSHRNQYESFVLHLTFSMKKREIMAIKALLEELSQGDALGTEFVAFKFNDHNDFFGFSAEHNSRIPREGTVARLSHKDFLMWFSGIGVDDFKVPKKPERPVHVRVLYPEERLQEVDLKRLLQDSMNIAGANWRGFNSKSLPISIYYAKLIADYYAHFREAGLPDINLENMSPWFL